MGKYQDFVNLAVQSTPEFTQMQIIPRGAPIIPDLLMTGQMRFGRRLGANVSVINPDNQILLTSAAQVSQATFNVDRTLQWFEQGALLTFNKTEMMILQDWDPTNNQVIVDSPLTVTWPNGSPLYLWATPLVVHTDASAGDTVLTVRSRYNILNDDVITLPVSSSINSLNELNVTISQSGGTYLPDPDFTLVFALSLDQPLPIDLKANESQIFLRAYPGYTSTVLPISRFQNNQLGPFLVDYLSTPLDNIESYQEGFAIRTFNSANVPIDGTGVSYKTVTKNYPILSLPIWAEGLVFWDVMRGSGGFASPNRYRLITDSEGKARVATNLVPAWQSGYTWNFKVRSVSNGLVRVWTDTYGFQDFTLIAFQTLTIQLTTPPGGTINRVEILALLDIAGAEIQIADGTIQGATVSQIQYTFVFKVLGYTNFQSTSLIIKPFFMALSDLYAQYDSGQNYDSGFIYQ